MDRTLYQSRRSHFYLTDNGSTDKPLDILQPYIDSGLVSYEYNETKHNQAGFLHFMMNKYNIKNSVKWLIECDLDEFYFGLNAPLANVIDKYSGYDVIYSNWYMFGSNNFSAHPPDIRTALTTRKKNVELDINTKYIVQVNRLKNTNDMDVHWINGEYNTIRENDQIRLYHYTIQSREFFEKVKMNRCDAMSAGSDSVRDWAYFYRFDENTDFEDF